MEQHDTAAGAITSERDGLGAQLERIAEHLERREGNPAGELAALLPCEPVTGPSVVACWRDGDDLTYEVVRLADAAPITQPAAIREAFTLLAMAEALEAVLDRDGLEELAAVAREWREGAGPAQTTAPAAAGAELATTVASRVEAVESRLVALAGLAPRAAARMATATLLDHVGGELGQLERELEALTGAAEAWAAAVHQGEPARVERLWQLVAAVHRGPLSVPPSILVQQGREAGRALASDVLGSSPD
jgi:hypothetical protein